MNGVHAMLSDNPATQSGFFKHRSVDTHFTSIPSFLSRCGSRSGSRRRMDAATTTTPPSLSRSASRRSTGSVPFSNSDSFVRSPSIQKKLECTLEELCYGCIKKMKIIRDVITDTGEMVREEEVLRIKVKPGWKIGTRITFEGMGNERPGTSPGDITFMIAEKWHPLFRREGDDLELAIEIPLVKALTGFTLTFPLLGGEKMNPRIDDIIYPGYERTIAGQGMPNPNDQGRRGDLRIKFLVEFPTRLTDQQRSDILGILQDCS